MSKNTETRATSTWKCLSCKATVTVDCWAAKGERNDGECQNCQQTTTWECRK